MSEIRPNSQRYKESIATPKPVEDRKKLQPVVGVGRASVQKKNGFSKIAGNIISEDAKNVKSYILLDVLVPAVKKAISDIVTNGIDIILYGETGHTKRSTAGRVSYINYSDRQSDRLSRGGTRYDSRDSRDRSESRSRSVSLFDPVKVDTMGEAKDILERMSEYLESYDYISVADLYDLANISNFPHTYNNYGWRSVVDAQAVRVSDGYILKMPPVEPIK